MRRARPDRRAAVASYQPDTPQPLWAEQWPAVWLDAVSECIAGCVKLAQGIGTRLRCRMPFAPSASAASTAARAFPSTSKMQPLHPCLIWMDRRANAEVEWVRANIDLDGLQHDHRQRRRQLLRLHQDAVAEEQPGPTSGARPAICLPPNAFVDPRISPARLPSTIRRPATSAASTTSTARTWSAEMLDALGIPAAMMPARLVDSTDVVGGLTAEAAATPRTPCRHARHRRRRGRGRGDVRGRRHPQRASTSR